MIAGVNLGGPAAARSSGGLPGTPVAGAAALDAASPDGFLAWLDVALPVVANDIPLRRGLAAEEAPAQDEPVTEASDPPVGDPVVAAVPLPAAVTPALPVIADPAAVLDEASYAEPGAGVARVTDGDAAGGRGAVMSTSPVVPSGGAPEDVLVGVPPEEPSGGVPASPSAAGSRTAAPGDRSPEAPVVAILDTTSAPPRSQVLGAASETTPREDAPGRPTDDGARTPALALAPASPSRTPRVRLAAAGRSEKAEALPQVANTASPASQQASDTGSSVTLAGTVRAGADPAAPRVTPAAAALAAAMATSRPHPVDAQAPAGDTVPGATGVREAATMPMRSALLAMMGRDGSATAAAPERPRTEGSAPLVLPVTVPDRGLGPGRTLVAPPLDTAGAPPLDDVLPTQILRSIRLQWQAGQGEARIRLRPDYLGELTVAVKVEQGGVVATLRAETPEVRRWIETHSGSLRDALAEQGLRLDRLVVADERGRQDGPGADRRQRQDGGHEDAPPRRRHQAAPHATFDVPDQGSHERTHA